LRLTRQQVTEFLYVHDIRELRGQIERYLSFKAGLWILFDNLDKGWSAHGLAPEDLPIIRCLLDATRKMEQSLQTKGVDWLSASGSSKNKCSICLRRAQGSMIGTILLQDFVGDLEQQEILPEGRDRMSLLVEPYQPLIAMRHSSSSGG
jgi:hypothetical protein